MNETGKVSEQDKQAILSIQEAVAPGVLGTPIADTLSNIEKYVVPQYRSNIAGAYYTRDEWLATVRAGNLIRHTSIRHEETFFSVGDTIICFGLADGADYTENGDKSFEQCNVPFCDIFVRLDGNLRLAAVTSSAVKDGSFDSAD